jgi:sterol desaturase/sphingolipid hydroxylase (fatty acid hydroxylase superfamily)
MPGIGRKRENKRAPMNGVRAFIGTDILTVFFPLTFLAMAFWEARQPSRPVTTPLMLRWFGNIALFGLASLIPRMLPFLSGYGAASIARSNGWGLLNVVVVQPTVAMALSLVALDFLAYWTHRLFHKVSFLWRLHALHHSDTDLDVSTTIRHHPLETLAQMLIDASIAILVGLSPEAIALYGSVVLIVQTFNHGNVVLPRHMCWMNAWLMTPDLHRLHHSTTYAENNSNFGNLIPLWDRAFGTLSPRLESELHIGLPGFIDSRFQRLDMMLAQPLLVTIAPMPSHQSHPQS